ncbi:MAG: sigma-54 dependent transcriptional regulator [Pseudomonadota bacterium]
MTRFFLDETRGSRTLEIQPIREFSLMSQTVLIVDDDASIRKTLGMLLVKRMEFKVIEAEDGRDCLSILETDKNDKIKLIILDLNMPVLSGMETLETLHEKHPSIPVIMLTASKEVEDAVQAMKLGAMDFMTKPVQPERMIVSVQNALKMNALSREVTRLKKQTDGQMTFKDLIGHDNGLKDVIQVGTKAAASNIPVLISGETGVGKEVFARAIHGESERAGAPFIAVNCGAIPEKLVESTLFGHEKGAFTGAVTKAAGKFREADGGTIFLDEVGELPLDAQVKLLRVLQQKEVEPVGAGQSVPVDVRVVSATNRNLEHEIEKGNFREDLYFRLNVLPIELPPLCNRKDDILPLAYHFIERFAASENRMLKDLTDEAEKGLKCHSWPGNVRELENTIHRAMVLSENINLDTDDLIFTSSRTTGGESVFMSQGTVSIIGHDGSVKSIADLEKEIITFAIEHHNNNVTRADAELGIGKSTIYRKIGKKAYAEP